MKNLYFAKQILRQAQDDKMVAENLFEAGSQPGRKTIQYIVGMPSGMLPDYK